MGVIDISIGPFTPELMPRFSSLKFWKMLGRLGEASTQGKGWPLEDVVAIMDQAGVEKGIIFSVWTLDPTTGQDLYVTPQEVAKMIDKYPDRFVGQVGFSPLRVMDAVRHIERAVKDYGFKGAHLYPHWFDLPIDHAKYYPIYAKCVELDIPISIQVGRQAPLSGRCTGLPILIDTIAHDFPELRIVGLHMGYPWGDEMIAVARTYPNVYIGADSPPPRLWHDNLVKYVKGEDFPGVWLNSGVNFRDKVMWCSDFPVVNPVTSLKEIDALGFSEETKRKLTRDIAAKVFKL